PAPGGILVDLPRGSRRGTWPPDPRADGHPPPGHHEEQEAMHEGQPVAAAKAALRQEVLRRRRALPLADRLAASARIVASLDALPELLAARAVLGYAAFGSEVTIDEWLARRAARGDG